MATSSPDKTITILGLSEGADHDVRCVIIGTNLRVEERYIDAHGGLNWERASGGYATILLANALMWLQHGNPFPDGDQVEIDVRALQRQMAGLTPEKELS